MVRKDFSNISVFGKILSIVWALKVLLKLPKLADSHPRLTPTWQYFGTITCDGQHGVMKLCIDKP